MEIETQTLSNFELNSNPPFSYSVTIGTDTSDFQSPASGERSEMDFASASSGEPPATDLRRSEILESDVVPANCESIAAMTVQKVYRSYRTRRRLADSAVVAEELWWQAIDYARLNHSTISFFNFLKRETAASRWNRISLNASKVGKGLAEDAQAQKLAFQHWIEAIDPRHRYGHSLNKYYEEWCKSEAGQPFFFWLDIGDGKEVDLKECPRSELRQQCIKYLGPQERGHYQYIVAEGKVVHKQSGNFLDTKKGMPRAKWIFVMSTSKKLYAGQSISPYSGHYRPSDDSLDGLLSFLKENGVNLNELEIRKGKEDYENFEESKLDGEAFAAELLTESPPFGNSNEEENDTSLELQTRTKINYKRTLSGGLQSPRADVPKTAILQRIHSKKAASSYQLGKQLSRQWSTGAGPRIGCVADYPVELRLQALEFVHLSPRTPPTPSSYRWMAGLPLPTAPPSSDLYTGQSSFAV
ncbi:IQ domain-containing protein IQM3-like isoform X2 [Actinidia eriantha]|uniref:IQ domain-containing protein IQM3-like isoform X2 n=1 Tax=Actinidia eriantha TaxID=165200 RepID=UPI0025825836|nr:IQ domain-containing protein IQM3-like isoform X2 [Actinidia eriantha]